MPAAMAFIAKGPGCGQPGVSLHCTDTGYASRRTPGSAGADGHVTELGRGLYLGGYPMDFLRKGPGYRQSACADRRVMGPSGIKFRAALFKGRRGLGQSPSGFGQSPILV